MPSPGSCLVVFQGLADEQPKAAHRLGGFQRPSDIFTMTCSPDGRYIVTGDLVLRCWGSGAGLNSPLRVEGGDLWQPGCIVRSLMVA